MNTPNFEEQLSDIDRIIRTKTITPLSMKIAIYCAMRGGENQKVLREKIAEDLSISNSVLSRCLLDLVKSSFLFRSYKGEILHNLKSSNYSPKSDKIDQTANTQTVQNRQDPVKIDQTVKKPIVKKSQESVKIDQMVNGTEVATRARGSLTNTINSISNIYKGRVSKGNVHQVLDSVISENYSDKIPPEVQQCLLEYLILRFDKKLTVNPRVIKRLINKLTTLTRNESEALDMIERAITGGWKDFYAGEYGDNKKPSWRGELESEYHSAKQGSMEKKDGANPFPTIEGNRSDGDEVDQRIQHPVHGDFKRNMAGIEGQRDADGKTPQGI